MLWIRFKRWRYLTPLAPHAVMCASGRRYLWTNAEEGVTGVPYRSDAEELLNPPNDATSPFEIAWERYGVSFDSHGKVVPIAVPTAPQESEEGVPPPAPRGPGRPKKH